MKLLPQEVYGGEAHVKSLQDAVGAEAGAARAAQDELFMEIRLSTASKWGLTLFERDYGIPQGEALSLELRRARVRAKRKGRETTTKEVIRRLCEDFTGGDCTVMELYGAYMVHIRFDGHKGKPANMEWLAQAIREVLPAHLVYEFEYTYNRHRDLSRFTHGQLSRWRHRALREGNELSNNQNI